MIRDYVKHKAELYMENFHNTELSETDLILFAEQLLNEQKTWHYVTDKLPPNPKESEDGISITPLNYICAYDCGNGDYECDEFMYLGDGVWNGENKNYPIYAWMDCAVQVPLPPRKKEGVE